MVLCDQLPVSLFLPRKLDIVRWGNFSTGRCLECLLMSISKLLVSFESSTEVNFNCSVRITDIGCFAAWTWVWWQSTDWFAKFLVEWNFIQHLSHTSHTAAWTCTLRVQCIMHAHTATYIMLNLTLKLFPKIYLSPHLCNMQSTKYMQTSKCGHLSACCVSGRKVPPWCPTFQVSKSVQLQV